MSRRCYAQRLDITFFREMWVSVEHQHHAITFTCRLSKVIIQIWYEPAADANEALRKQSLVIITIRLSDGKPRLARILQASRDAANAQQNDIFELSVVGAIWRGPQPPQQLDLHVAQRVHVGVATCYRGL